MKRFELMSAGELHSFIYSFYEMVEIDSITAGDKTVEEAYQDVQERTDEIIDGKLYESLLADILDYEAEAYADLFWNIIAWFPKAYTNSIKKFQHSVQMFLTPAAVGVYRNGEWHEVFSTSEF